MEQELTACDTYDEVREVADRTVCRLNSIGNLLEPGYDPVHVGALIHTLEGAG